MSNYKTSINPSPQTRFSQEYFNSLTLHGAANIADYPQIAPAGSVVGWTWSKEEPTDPQAMTILPGEPIPAKDDLGTILANFHSAWKNGHRSVVIHTCVEGQAYTLLYHLSKIELIRLVNIYDSPQRKASSLLRHLEERSTVPLAPAMLDEFKQCKFLDGIKGFYSTKYHLYELFCFLNETWIEEDLLCGLLELAYFEKHASDIEDDPSLYGSAPAHIVLPTDFLSDAFAFSGGNVFLSSSTPLRIRIRLESTHVSTICAARLEHKHFTALAHQVGTEAFLHCDSMHGGYDQTLGMMISDALSTPTLPLPGLVRSGDVSRQGQGNGGDGSCGIAVLNFIQRALGHPESEKWTGQKSQYFRDRALVDLITFHLVSSKREGSFLDWVEPASMEVGEQLYKDTERERAMAAEGCFFTSAYHDFNLYKPLYSHPIFEFYHLTTRRSVSPRTSSESPMREIPHANPHCATTPRAIPLSPSRASSELDSDSPDTLPSIAFLNSTLRQPFTLNLTSKSGRRSTGVDALGKRSRSGSDSSSPNTRRPNKHPAQSTRSPSPDFEIVAVDYAPNHQGGSRHVKVEDRDSDIEVVTHRRVAKPMKVEDSDSDIEILPHAPSTPPRTRLAPILPSNLRVGLTSLTSSHRPVVPQSL
ncbi:hypothetical protein FA13DRAFT_1797765 [Coprinellus micaceus]|uniref:Uncharacterized protein n=1 Tax=Coprinellus micaceus TaxID=71717 RepID=A0A4Y7SPS8_COPMI|nr:hypothetical protein FA13DRAFT_1797765 [Coprinellus micaceus]